ncbi:NTP transferase domain-containing protein [Gordonia phosphorivorans]|uniref:NTP transferase domain-containing protein n=1 Tax=Gordonia phosphorivorans TaxID=1056982 RepID=A0ABV6H9Y9_9ACTN
MVAKQGGQGPDVRDAPVVGMVLVARGDEREAPGDGDVPQLERLELLLAGFGAGGCDALYVALGSRVVAAPRDTSTTFYLPSWYDGLDATVQAALTFARGLDPIAGVLLQTVDSADIGGVGVARLLAAAERRRDAVVRGVRHGHWGQPVYVGADLLDSAGELLAASGGAIGYLGDHADEVTCVDCSDLVGPEPSAH